MRMTMTEEIRDRLSGLAEEDYKAFNQKLLPGVKHILGVRLPALRKLAKETARGDFRAYLAEAQKEISGDSSFEEIMIQGLVIGYARMEQEEYRKYLGEFIPRITNWSVCDSCANSYKFMGDDPEYWFSYLKKYENSQKEFEIRFMIVSMLNHFTEADHIDEILSICEGIRHDGYYAKMGAAWALQVCYVKFPEKTKDFLENNRMADFVQNKAIQKIRESRCVSREEKEALRGFIRK